MGTYLFKIECLTDMHVGNGEANYSIIDNEVQKDTVLTDVPIIHASGVKGALKEHFERVMKWDEGKVQEVFGGTIKEDNGKQITVGGEYKFFSAICIARPLRVSDGDLPYILCTGDDILNNFSALLKGLGLSEFFKYIGISFDAEKFLSTEENVEIEGISAKRINPKQVIISEEISDKEIVLKNLKRLIGDKYAIAKSLRDYDLPIRARNVLDKNKQSENLWYEEIVPHKSIFYFALITPDVDTNYTKFKEDIEKQPVQFGGNASVGNGYTKVTEVGTK